MLSPDAHFIGDWPFGIQNTGREARPGGVGPARVDDLCLSCDKPISTTGECRCST